MMSKQRDVVSAQVVLVAPDNMARRGSETESKAGSPYGGIEVVKRYFAAAGFASSPYAGNSFAISGSPATFEKVFRCTLVRDEHGAMRAQDGDRTVLELPLHGIPAAVRTHIRAVTFTRPPEFGPKSFAD